MYLAIYKKANKWYFNFTNKLTDSFTVTNQDMKTVKLTYYHKVEHFPFNDWQDFKLLKEYLQIKYSLRMFVSETKYRDRTEIKVVLEMMNNPFYNITIFVRDELNPVILDGDCSIRVYELFVKSDWADCEKEFNFTSDFVDNLFDNPSQLQ